MAQSNAKLFLLILFMLMQLVTNGSHGCGPNERLLKGRCRPCPTCPVGYGLPERCGWGNGNGLTCKPCGDYTYNANPQANMCLPCTNCTLYRRNFVHHCRQGMLDAECGQCWPHYADTYKGQTSLFPCTHCKHVRGHRDCDDWRKKKITPTIVTSTTLPSTTTTSTTINTQVVTNQADVQHNKHAGSVGRNTPAVPAAANTQMAIVMVVCVSFAMLVVLVLVILQKTRWHQCSFRHSQGQLGKEHDDNLRNTAAKEKHFEWDHNGHHAGDNEDLDAGQSLLDSHSVPLTKKRFRKDGTLESATSVNSSLDNPEEIMVQQQKEAALQKKDIEMKNITSKKQRPVLYRSNSEPELSEIKIENPIQDSMHMNEMNRVKKADVKEKLSSVAQASIRNEDIGASLGRLVLPDKDTKVPTFKIPQAVVQHDAIVNAMPDYTTNLPYAYRFPVSKCAGIEHDILHEDRNYSRLPLPFGLQKMHDLARDIVPPPPYQSHCSALQSLASDYSDATTVAMRDGVGLIETDVDDDLDQSQQPISADDEMLTSPFDGSMSETFVKETVFVQPPPRPVSPSNYNIPRFSQASISDDGEPRFSSLEDNMMQDVRPKVRERARGCGRYENDDRAKKKGKKERRQSPTPEPLPQTNQQDRIREPTISITITNNNNISNSNAPIACFGPNSNSPITVSFGTSQEKPSPPKSTTATNINMEENDTSSDEEEELVDPVEEEQDTHIKQPCQDDPEARNELPSITPTTGQSCGSEMLRGRKMVYPVQESVSTGSSG